MIEYYNNLIKQTKNPGYIKYYKDRIKSLNKSSVKNKGKISVSAFPFLKL